MVYTLLALCQNKPILCVPHTVCAVRPHAVIEPRETQWRIRRRKRKWKNPLNTNNAQNKSKRLCVTNKTIVELINVHLVCLSCICSLSLCVCVSMFMFNDCEMSDIDPWNFHAYTIPYAEKWWQTGICACACVFLLFVISFARKR